VSRSATILRNIASNWAGFAVNAVVTLVLTPYLLHRLGVARYGIWILTSSIIGYYGILDVGFRAGVTQYLTRYLAVRDFRRASECISTAVAALSALGAVMVLLSVAAAWLAPDLFGFPTDVRHEAFWCILIVGVTSALQFVFAPFPALFIATQRFDLANLIGVATRLMSATGIVIALRMDGGLIGVSAVTFGVNTIDYLLRWRVATRLVPELEVSGRHVEPGRLREIGSFGLWNFLISVNTYVYTYVPNLLVGAVLPVTAVGHYALATGLSRQVNSVLSPVGAAVYPAATTLHVRGDMSGLERLYHDGSRLMMLAMIPTVLGACFWANDFYRLWIGERYVVAGPFESVAVLFQILLLSVITCYVSSIAQQILTGAGHVRQVAQALFLGSLINFGLSLALVRPFGLAGVATATVCASVVVDLIVMPWMLQRIVGLSVAGFLRHSCVRPALAGALQALLMAGVRVDGRAGTWLQLLLQGAVAGVGAMAIALSVGVTRAERQRFVYGPLARLLKRNKRERPKKPVEAASGL